jgi:hypothetical protein
MGDTLERVLSLIEAEGLARCFMNWVARVVSLTDGQGIAMDGQTGRGPCEKSGPNGLPLVSAWATANCLTLGQVNEIAAIPQLLARLTRKAAW